MGVRFISYLAFLTHLFLQRFILWVESPHNKSKTKQIKIYLQVIPPHPLQTVVWIRVHHFFRLVTCHPSPCCCVYSLVVLYLYRHAAGIQERIKCMGRYWEAICNLTTWKYNYLPYWDPDKVYITQESETMNDFQCEGASESFTSPLMHVIPLPNACVGVQWWRWRCWRCL